MNAEQQVATRGRRTRAEVLQLVSEFANERFSEATACGYVEQVPVMRPYPHASRRTWYRQKKIGVIYSLDPPNERSGWSPEVDPKDSIEPGEKIQ